MTIVNSIGFQYYRPLENVTRSDFRAIGDLFFQPNNLNNGYSRFRFTEINGRLWLTSSPGSDSRSEIQYWDPGCYRWGWRDTYTAGPKQTISSSVYNSTYISSSGPGWHSKGIDNEGYGFASRWRRPWVVSGRVRVCVAAGRWVTNWSETYDRRRVDSSRRTPSFQLRIRDLFANKINDERFLIFGFRIYFPFLNNIPQRPVFIQTNYGDVSTTLNSSTTIMTLLSSSDIEVQDNFLEVKVDRKSGCVRRWLNNRELSPIFLSSHRVGQLIGGCLHFGEKSVSTATNAPDNNYFSLNDFIAAVSNHYSDPEFGERIGSVEVEYLPVASFELDRHWGPPLSYETPEETVNRVKLSSSPSAGLVGDTHSTPATVTFEEAPIGQDEEIIYANAKVWGTRADSNGADSIKIISISKIAPNGQHTNVSLANNYLQDQYYNANSVYEISLRPLSTENVLRDLRLKVGFEK